MNWVKLAILLLEVTGAFVRWVEQNKIASEAERQMLQRARGMIDANIAKAENARARVRADLDARPDSLRDDTRGPWRDD
jgi:hypothetical protein